ncbi:TPA: Crp/Fnr family transcriptional regulator [Raoultella planticola]|nr:Crp/Fnr family transcriptional regulator [Raoultella planticola]HAT1648198.1 Crp/Fnr family transcriptional regulator [Raoultella planticola]
MQVNPPTKPEQAMSRLINALLPYAATMNTPPRKRITWGCGAETNLYIFLDGELSVLRSSDNLVLITVYKPHLFGIAEMIQPLHSHILRVETNSTILRIRASEARTIFRKENLWEDVSVLLSYNSAYMSYRDNQVVQQRTYSIIRNFLLELILLPNETRMRVSVLAYIQERTHLSRSSIFNVLCALKKGGYINLSRGGYLVEIKLLPSGF